MNKKLGLIDRILAGKKTIETRWYKNKIVPWGKIFPGDKVYFKDSGGPVWAVATVAKVEEIDNLNLEKTKKIIKKYGETGKIDIQNKKYLDWSWGKNYCILIWLKEATKIEPFEIDKAGFGTGAAWIMVENVDIIKRKLTTSGGRTVRRQSVKLL